MESWTNRPTRGEVTRGTKLIRAKPGKAIGGIGLNGDIVGAYTHFWQGRTRICDGQGCEACEANRAARWYGYIGIMHETSKEVAILELTAGTIGAIEEHIKRYGSLRGARISVKRGSQKINSKIIATIEQTTIQSNELPLGPFVEEILSRMWEVHKARAPEMRKGQNLNTNGKPNRVM